MTKRKVGNVVPGTVEYENVVVIGAAGIKTINFHLFL
jgi:hypothetical protein